MKLFGSDRKVLDTPEASTASGAATIAPQSEVPLRRENDAPPIAQTKLHRTVNGGIALALGGGAAKGWAHIGLLRAFDEARVPVSMIAGTSIGALVGGCYLAGRLDELEEFARSLTWSNLIRYLDFSIRGSGLISGQRLASKMEQHLGTIAIEEMVKPFVSICTDIRTGHEIWLHDGPLIEAIRASYALPGVFNPVRHNGRMLVDGALVNPVPVSACRAYEPDVVIAVDLNSETFGRGTVIRSSHYDHQETILDRMVHSSARSSLSAFIRSDDHHVGENPALNAAERQKQQTQTRLGMSGVMMEAFNIIQDRIARARLAGDPPDYTIRPKLHDIGLADFHKADESIRIGYQEGKNRLKDLVGQDVFAAAI
ncbi:MAG: patatin-like phospholipase family protein [Rhizobiaceae bacterium]